MLFSKKIDYDEKIYLSNLKMSSTYQIISFLKTSNVILVLNNINNASSLKFNLIESIDIFPSYQFMIIFKFLIF